MLVGGNATALSGAGHMSSNAAKMGLWGWNHTPGFTFHNWWTNVMDLRDIRYRPNNDDSTLWTRNWTSGTDRVRPMAFKILLSPPFAPRTQRNFLVRR